MSLTDKLLKGVKKRGIGDTLKDSDYGRIDYYLDIGTIAMNLMTSGKWNGGCPSSKVTMFAGPKSSTKTQNAYQIMKTHQAQGGVVVLVDSEHATDMESLEAQGIDTEKVIYLPLARIDDEDKEMSMMYQISNMAEDIDKEDKVLMVFDSAGAWTSGRTVANALKGNTAKDMSITSEKKKLMNLLMEIAGVKKIPIIVINHTYANVGGFGAATEVSGGGILYIPSTVIEITSKAKLKWDDYGVNEGFESKEPIGAILTASVYKGRLSRENSKMKFAIHANYGFLRYYGLIDYAVEGGYVETTKEGHSTMYTISGTEIKTPKKKMYLPEEYPFWEELFKTTDFGEYLNAAFSYGSNKKLTSMEEE